MTAHRRTRPLNVDCEATGFQSKQQPKNIDIIVSPRVDQNGGLHPYDFDCWLEEGPLLCTSRQPFLQAARVLIALGHDPVTTLIMRHNHSKVGSLRARLGAAAGLSIDEHNGTRFVSWKPFPIKKTGPRSLRESKQHSPRAGRTTLRTESNNDKT
jgi:hypothetical protein